MLNLKSLLKSLFMNGERSSDLRSNILVKVVYVGTKTILVAGGALLINTLCGDIKYGRRR